MRGRISRALAGALVAGTLVVAACERNDPHTHTESAPAAHHTPEAWSVSYVPNDGQVLLISRSGKVYVYTGKNGTQAQPVEVSVGSEGGKMHLDLSQ